MPLVPHQYVADAAAIQKTPAKLGTFGGDPRFKPGVRVKTTPGVGDYDLTNFKNFAKASETIFEIPKYRKLAQRKLERH